MGTNMINILLVDDHASVRAGLRMRFGLEPDLNVVGEAADGVTAIHLAKHLTPNIILMDAEMPRMDGITATHRLSSHAPDSPVVILSAHDNDDLRARAKAAGAAAFVSKTQFIEPLIAAIRDVANRVSFPA